MDPYLQQLQQRIAALQTPQQRPQIQAKPMGDWDRKDWGQMLMAFGSGAAGGRDLADTFARGGRGVASHVQSERKRMAGDRDRNKSEMHRLQDLLFRHKRDDERYKQRQSNEEKRRQLELEQAKINRQTQIADRDEKRQYATDQEKSKRTFELIQQYLKDGDDPEEARRKANSVMNPGQASARSALGAIGRF